MEGNAAELSGYGETREAGEQRVLEAGENDQDSEDGWGGTEKVLGGDCLELCLKGAKNSEVINKRDCSRVVGSCR